MIYTKSMAMVYECRLVFHECRLVQIICINPRVITYTIDLAKLPPFSEPPPLQNPTPFRTLYKQFQKYTKLLLAISRNDQQVRQISRFVLPKRPAKIGLFSVDNIGICCAALFWLFCGKNPRNIVSLLIVATPRIFNEYISYQASRLESFPHE